LSSSGGGGIRYAAPWPTRASKEKWAIVTVYDAVSLEARFGRFFVRACAPG